jgi:hypothetical protein
MLCPFFRRINKSIKRVWEGRMKWFRYFGRCKKWWNEDNKELKIKEIPKSLYHEYQLSFPENINDIDRNIKTIKLFFDINRENIRYIEEEDDIIRIAYYEKRK